MPFTGVVSIHKDVALSVQPHIPVLVRLYSYQIDSGVLDYAYEIFVNNYKVTNRIVENKEAPRYPSGEACLNEAKSASIQLLERTTALVQCRLCACGHMDTEHYGDEQPCKECICTCLRKL